MVRWYNVAGSYIKQSGSRMVSDLSSIKEGDLSKESKSKQTLAVEKLMKDVLSSKLLDYSDKVFSVGGFVRDKLLNSNPDDMDIVVDDPKDKMKSAEVFSKKLADVLNITTPNNPHVLSTDYGIWGVDLLYPRDQQGNRRPFIYDNTDISGYTIELTPPREEGPYDFDKAKPSWVEYTSRKEDALRRDLTVNSIFQNVVTGELEDYTGGIKDLENKKLRKPDHPNRDKLDIYRDDPTRLLRLIRFQGKLDGFSVDDGTKNDAINFIKSSEGQKIISQKLKPEAVQKELHKVLTHTNGDVAAKGLESMREFGLLKYISPTFDKLTDIYHDKVFHRGESVWEHTLDVLKRTPPTLKARLSALFHDIGKLDTMSTKIDKEGRERFQFIGHEKKSPEYVSKILKELKFPIDIIESVRDIVHSHMGMKNIDAEKAQTQLRRIRVFIEKLYNSMDDALDLMQADIKDAQDAKERQDKINKFNELRKRIKEQSEHDLKIGLFSESGKGGMIYKSPLTGDEIANEYKNVQRNKINKNIEKGKIPKISVEEIERSLKNIEGKALGAVKTRLKEMTMEGRFGEGAEIAVKAKEELKNLLSSEQQIQSLIKNLEDSQFSKDFYIPKKP